MNKFYTLRLRQKSNSGFIKWLAGRMQKLEQKLDDIKNELTKHISLFDSKKEQKQVTKSSQHFEQETFQEMKERSLVKMRTKLSRLEIKVFDEKANE